MEYNTSAKGPNIELKNRLETSANEANELLLKHDVVAMSKDELTQILREYVRLRYLLDESDMQENDHFNYLGEVSLARGLGLSVDAVRKSELDSKCEGTSSTMTKKILLIIALSRTLEIETDPERNADITTIDKLADYIYEILHRRSGQ